MIDVGQRLYKVRIKKKLTLEEISEAIKIKPCFLDAIEKGEFSKLPSPAYAQGFVRNYAAYLGLPKAEITAFFKREFDEKRAYKVLPDALVRQEDFPVKRIRVQQSLLLAGLVLLLFGAYLLFQYRSAIMPPPLSVSIPKDGAVVPREVMVKGKTDVNSSVFVNNEVVSIGKDGVFIKKLTLFPGKSTVTIKAKNRFGKESTVLREVIVK